MTSEFSKLKVIADLIEISFDEIMEMKANRSQIKRKRGETQEVITCSRNFSAEGSKYMSGNYWEVESQIYFFTEG